ncbi:MAG: response regulator [Pseudomonadota bacterium]|nr:response regulator [Pseudomonadota bacterium]
MLVRTQILIFGLIGNIIIAGILLYMNVQNQNIQEKSSNSQYTSIVESAWVQSIDNSFANMNSWGPNGEKGEQYWNPYVEIGLFTEIGIEGFDYANALIETFDQELKGDLFILVDEMFLDEIDEGNISFIKFFSENNEELSCLYAYDWADVGNSIDVCSESNQLNFLRDTSIDNFLAKIRTRMSVTNEVIYAQEPSGNINLHQIVAFPVYLKNEFGFNTDKLLGSVIIGRDLRQSMTIFESDLGVRTGIVSQDTIIDAVFSDELSQDDSLGINQMSFNYIKGDILKNGLENMNSKNFEALGLSLTSVPVASTVNPDFALFFVIKNVANDLKELRDSTLNSIIFTFGVILLIVLAIWWVQDGAFSRIAQAIEVLEALTKGDTKKQLPVNKGFLASETNEVGQLSNALGRYRNHLLEMDSVRKDRAERRKQRDEVIIKKMSVLSDKLEGDAKTLIQKDVQNMRKLVNETSDEKAEEASVEMMELAFSRMSDEVNALIDLKTKEMATARDEAREASSAKSRFFANMSHELRTPLNAIIGYSEMLLEDCEDLGNDEMVPDLKRITNSSKHLLSLINNVLDLSKIEAGKMDMYFTPFNIDTMIETIKDVSGPLASKNNNEFIIKNNVKGEMTSDETKLRQCIVNFLSNAFKFTENGQVALVIGSKNIDKKEYVNFDIKDTGIGMTEDQLGKLFDTYTQAERSTSAKYGGTGLGLSISKHFAEMMGGGVEVSSKVGEGSTFSIFVPRVSLDEEQIEEEDFENPEIQKGDEYILLVDDDKATHDVVKRAIKKEGHTVFSCFDGDEGIEQARKVEPKLILLDVLMPGRDGWSVLKELKKDKKLKNIPVVITSVLNEESLASSLGADDYMKKPIDRTFFLNIVKRYITEKDQKVLIVDDYENTRDLLNKILNNEGYLSIDAKNGEDALERVKEKPDLIVLDLDMPKMDGFEFIERTQEDGIKIPIVVFSGKDITAVEEKMLSKFTEGIVKKESKVQTLVNEVNQILKGNESKSK